jgi:hypothetical protein
MKKILLAFLICFNTLFCFSQTFPKKQILIPLSNVNGVPFYKDEELHDLAIDGFEIDNKGNFYFMGGDKMECLAVFSADKQIFRKKYKECPDCHLYIYKDTLYTFNRQTNDLIVLNSLNGSLIKVYNHITSKHFNSYAFADSSLIAEILNYPNRNYEQYTFSGKYVKAVPNSYNITQFTIPKKNAYSDCAFLGKWDNNYIFWAIVDDNDSQIQKFWLVNDKGKMLATKSLQNKGNIFGQIYAENPNEHRKVRNGNLYVLGRKGNNALITEIPLDSFFGRQ